MAHIYYVAYTTFLYELALVAAKLYWKEGMN